MPVKIGKSVRKVVRGASRPSIEYTHEYIKTKSNGELIDMYNASGTIPKKKQKIKNELVRRNKVGKARVVFR
jgi:hypothetical protein